MEYILLILFGEVRYKFRFMTHHFRILPVLAILCVAINSLSISSAAHHKNNEHMLKVHTTAYQFAGHLQQSADGDDFISRMEEIIEAVQGSINQFAPSIIQTKDLESFTYSRNTCESLDEEDKQNLMQKAEETRADIATFKKALNDQADVKNNANNADKYLSTLQTLLSKNCEDVENVVVGPTIYQTNINTNKPWVLGGVTFNDLVKDYIQRIEQNNNVTNCGDRTPFFTGFACIDCEDVEPIFNISSSECSSCPEGLFYNAKTKKCGEKVLFKPNPSVKDKVLEDPTNPDGQDEINDYLNEDGEGETCPQEKPFVKDDACFRCPEDKPFYHIDKLECIKPMSPHEDIDRYYVIKGKNNTDEDVEDYINQEGEQCPWETPFTKNYECIECPPEESFFSLELNDCVDSVRPQQGIEPKVIGSNNWGEDSENQNSTDSPDTVEKYMAQIGRECPEETPFVQDNECIDCPENASYFSLKEQECVNAVRPSSGVSPKVLIGPSQQTEDVDDYINQKGDECPEQAPFVKDNECIACEPLPFFNIESNQCQECPGFDEESHRCPGPKHPHPSAEPSISLDGNLTDDDLNDYMNQEGEDCPESKPFVSQNKCIECPEDKPLFSIDQNKCIACESLSLFDSDTHQCTPAEPEATKVNQHEPTLMMNDNSTEEDWDAYVEENKNKALCPDEAPYWNLDECIQCPEYFNVIEYACDKCPDGLTLNTESHTCEAAEPLEPKLIDLFNAIF